MTIRACVLAILVGATIGQTPPERPPENRESFIAADRALVGIDQLGITVAVDGAEQDIPRIDVPKLKTQVVEKLRGAGLRPVEGETGLLPSLVVRIEGTAVPGSGKCVWRVQMALTRIVMLPNWPEVQLAAEVWQGRPVLEVVAQEEAAAAVMAAVRAQAEAFLAAHQAARSLLPVPPDLQPNVAAPTAPPQAFISSKNSQVFHRPDCRWTQNIASDNRVGYNSRQEAVQAGKRPCKTCQP
jgi:hypothetical protein